MKDYANVKVLDYIENTVTTFGDGVQYVCSVLLTFGEANMS